jgi:hypothetical protein
MPSAVEGDLLVLIVAIGTGADDLDTPAGWGEVHVAGTDDISLYILTRTAGTGGSGGVSVNATTSSAVIASAVGYNFGSGKLVGLFAPDGAGNSSFSIEHDSFTGTAAADVQYCSVACWEFARTLLLWPIDYPNNREVEEQNNCNLAASLSDVRSTFTARPDYEINNAAEWSGVGFFIKDEERTCTECGELSNRRGPCGNCHCEPCWGCKEKPVSVILTQRAGYPLTCCNWQIEGTWALDFANPDVGSDSAVIATSSGCHTGRFVFEPLAVDCAGLFGHHATINVVLQHRKTVTVEIWYWTWDGGIRWHLVRERYRTELTGSYGNCAAGNVAVPFIGYDLTSTTDYGFVDDICGGFELDNFFDVEIVMP